MTSESQDARVWGLSVWMVVGVARVEGVNR